MRELKHTIGPLRAGTIETVEFLTWAEEVKDITPETIGEHIAVAEFSLPQRGWYSEAYVRSESYKINDAISWLRILADEYLAIGG